MSCLLSKQRLFVGFTNYHLEQPFLKSSFNEVWEEEQDFLNSSCSRFREDITANPYVFRYWQLAKNKFYPMRREGRFFFLIKKDCLKDIKQVLDRESYKTICLNDSALCSNEDYLIINAGLMELFEKKFPQKSSFEI